MVPRRAVGGRPGMGGWNAGDRLTLAAFLFQVGQDRYCYARRQRSQKPRSQPHEEVQSVLHEYPLSVIACLRCSQHLITRMIPQHSLDTSRGHSVVLFQKQQDAALSVCPVDGRCHRARSWMSRRLNFRGRAEAILRIGRSRASYPMKLGVACLILRILDPAPYNPQLHRPMSSSPMLFHSVSSVERVYRS